MTNSWEHPDVAYIQRTGGPPPAPRAVGCCAVCGQEVYAYESRGLCGGRMIHADCADDEWSQLTALEKLTCLGYPDAVIRG